MVDMNELQKALLKHQGLRDPAAIELTRCMQKVAYKLDLLSGLLKAEQEDCQLQRMNKIAQWERAEKYSDALHIIAHMGVSGMSWQYDYEKCVNIAKVALEI